MHQAIRTHVAGTYRYTGGDEVAFARRIRQEAETIRLLSLSMPQGGILEGEANSLRFKALRLERFGLENWREIDAFVSRIEAEGAKFIFALRGYKL